MDLIPVDHDPFANAPPPAVPNGVTLQPVDHDPWAPYVNPETGRPEISVSKAPAEGVVAKSGQSIAQPSVAEQVAGFPQRAADMTIGALGPIGEAGMTVGDMLRTGHVDPRDIPQVAGGVMLGVAAPEAGEAAPFEAGVNLINETEPEMVSAFNKSMPTIKDQYYRWAGANHGYQELTPDDAEAIYGDEMPEDLRGVLDTHGRAVEISADNELPQYFSPSNAPTLDEHMQNVVENEGGMLPVKSLDEAYATLGDTRGIDPIFANGEALKVLAKKLGWKPSNGVKYFTLSKDNYPTLDVRVSDHGNLTRSNPNATTPDINLAPGAHDFHDAASIMMQQEPELEEASPLEAGAETVAKGITAYHGSPYDFDKFDLSKIGTGEGAQAYGHGLYFAENPSVAETYAQQLAQKATTQPIPADIRSALKSVGDLGFDRPGQALNVFRDILAGRDSRQNWDLDRPEDAAAVKTLFDYAAQPRAQEHRYEVSINADPEHFLDWDKPLSQQSEHVQNAIAGLGVPDPLGGGTFGTSNHIMAPGNEIWKAVAAHAVQPEDQRVGFNAYTPYGAMDQLRQAGIPGIKYLDQGSRGQTRWIARHPLGGINDFSNEAEAQAFVRRNPEFSLEGPKQTSNYVVFDDKLVDIIKKYGLAGLIAGGASHFAARPVDHDPFAAQSP